MVYMPQKSKHKISELVLLIHPLFSLIDFSSRVSSKIEKSNARFLLGIWGRQLKNAALNPKALIVIVLPSAYPANKIRRPWSYGRLTRFLSFAKKQFGERLIIVNGSIDIKKLRKEINAHGFVFDKKALKGKSFGEYFGACVADQSQRMQMVLPKGANQIERKQALSVLLTYRTKRKKLTAKRNPNKRKPMV